MMMSRSERYVNRCYVTIVPVASVKEFFLSQEHRYWYRVYYSTRRDRANRETN